MSQGKQQWIRFLSSKKKGAPLFSYRDNPEGITVGKRGGKSFTICLCIQGINSIFHTSQTKTLDCLYVKQFFEKHTWLNSVWQEWNQDTGSANFFFGLLKLKFPSPVKARSLIYKLQRAGTLELVLLEPIYQGIQVEDPAFPNWSGVGRVSEKMCPASDIRKSKFFPLLSWHCLEERTVTLLSPEEKSLYICPLSDMEKGRWKGIILTQTIII